MRFRAVKRFTDVAAKHTFGCQIFFQHTQTVLVFVLWSSVKLFICIAISVYNQLCPHFFSLMQRWLVSAKQTRSSHEFTGWAATQVKWKHIKCILILIKCYWHSWAFMSVYIQYCSSFSLAGRGEHRDAVLPPTCSASFW